MPRYNTKCAARLSELTTGYLRWRNAKTRRYEDALIHEDALIQAEKDYERAKRDGSSVQAHARWVAATQAALVARAKFTLGRYLEEELNGCRG